MENKQKNKSKKAEKFVIIGSERTGSNLLLTMLNNHQKIRSYGEIFGLHIMDKNELGKWCGDGERATKEDMLERVKNPIGYIENRIYKKEGKANIKSFKLFYNHLTPYDISSFFLESYSRITGKKSPLLIKKFSEYIEKNPDSKTAKRLREAWLISAELRKFFDKRIRKLNGVWKYLHKNKDIKVIHVKRKNLLRCYLSRQMAFLTGEWLKFNEKRSNKEIPKIRINPGELENYFKKIEKQRRKTDLLFNRHEKIDVFYENLVKNKKESIKKVLEFLGVEDKKIKVETPLKKQNTKNLRESISNYDELKEYFRKTKWMCFFEE